MRVIARVGKEGKRVDTRGEVAQPAGSEEEEEVASPPPSTGTDGGVYTLGCSRRGAAIIMFLQRPLASSSLSAMIASTEAGPFFTWARGFSAPFL